jgi:hypothetical protein
MKLHFLLLCMVLTDLTLYAQTQNLAFSYDEEGNRYAKNLVQLKSADTDSNTEDHQTDTTIYREILGDLTVTLYPNPTNGFIYVKLENLDPTTESCLIILDSTGKVLDVRKSLQTVNLLDLTKFSSGLFFIKIEVGKTVSNWTIIKE